VAPDSEPRSAMLATQPLERTQPENPMLRTEPLPSRGVIEETAPRDVSIEELIDLEQQAEFFVVLGQDDAAVDLLVEHLRHTGGGSPLPYLKLLEIYRRRGRRAEYERLRERFNLRFNAYAPEWEADLQAGRTLDTYAGVIPRLQQVWPRPLDAMAELEALLFRKSRGDLFELPAYREVLFLYSLARDLLDREAADSGQIDLLLPLADGGEFSSTSPAPYLALERESASGALDGRATAPLDFDLSSDPGRPTSIFGPLEDVPERPRRR
jgi:pilus assembly protein FimV